jgi:hypothetical protein
MRRQLRAAHSEHAEAPSGPGTLVSGYRPSGEAVDVVLHAESVVASRQKPSLSDINRPVDPALTVVGGAQPQRGADCLAGERGRGVSDRTARFIVSVGSTSGLGAA